jgi:uroporphyrin-III C-methyltransferase / precorrin-2 dehydrogenase / sirohydrochlorin ferrochelatase
MYPVMLHVDDKPCLVVGGGAVALRKVQGLLLEHARVTVVAEQPLPAIVTLADEAKITLERRGYRSPEAGRYALAFAATDDRDVNHGVFVDARAAGTWVNVADDPELCTFHLPAQVRRGALQVAVASAGEAPFVVRRLRQLLERRFGPEWAEWLAAAARFRRQVRRLGLGRDGQEARYDAFFGATVDPARWAARVPSAAEEAQLLGATTCAAAEPGAALDRAPGPAAVAATTSAPPGLVSLVGAGPGDPQLLTLRARHRLLGADAVVCDRLALTALPCDLPERVEIHPVGKEAGRHPVPQEQITALLVGLARQGKRVVRLKGGDPYVFGRGSEEAEGLARAGIRFEIVPGVTAGIAVPACAGIPVTHRREAVRVTMVTAHEAAKSGGPQVRWDLLAQDPHATIVGYMGLSCVAKAASELIAAGLDPSTPAAMIQQGTTSRQRVVRTTVARLPEAVRTAGLEPPALFVIGPTAGRGAELDWLARLPLSGHRVVLVAPGGSYAEQLALAGAELVQVPLPLTPAARLVLGALPLTACIVRTAGEVEALDEERDGPGWGPEVAVYALGPEAAGRAAGLGWSRVTRLDASLSPERLVGALASHGRSTGGVGATAQQAAPRTSHSPALSPSRKLPLDARP